MFQEWNQNLVRTPTSFHCRLGPGTCVLLCSGKSVRLSSIPNESFFYIRRGKKHQGLLCPAESKCQSIKPHVLRNFLLVTEICQTWNITWIVKRLSVKKRAFSVKETQKSIVIVRTNSRALWIPRCDLWSVALFAGFRAFLGVSIPITFAQIYTSIILSEVWFAGRTNVTPTLLLVFTPTRLPKTICGFVSFRSLGCIDAG